MVRRPDTPDTLLRAQDWLVRLPQLLATCVAQQFHLLHDFERSQIPHADWFVTSVDVVADDDWVLSWSGRNGKFDLGIGGGELREETLDETTAQEVLADADGRPRVFCVSDVTYFMPLELPAQSQ